LDKPELGRAFSNGCNSSAEIMAFSWRPVDEVNDYTLKISDSYSFPEGNRTFTVHAGNTDSYTLTSEEQRALYTLSNNSSIVRPILYWTVVPTNGDVNITTQTRQITGRKIIKLVLAPTSYIQMSGSVDESGVFRLAINGNDPQVYTTNISKIINPGASGERGKLTVSWAYRSDVSCRWEFFFSNPNYAAGVSAKTETLPASEEWREAVFDIGEYMQSFTWGTATNHRFRIDPGDSREESNVPTNRTVYLTNMQINIY
jgi:hypothetical protein